MQQAEPSPLQVAARTLPCVLLAVILGWFVPSPEAVHETAWHLFAIFLAVILAFITRPMAMAPVVLIGLVAAIVTGSCTTEQAMSGYGNETSWLVVAAFLIADAVISTGFGRRISLMLASWLGSSTLGLGYSLCAAELILSPVVPSNTARGGGLLAPIARSLAAALGSEPHDRPELGGRYLMLVGAHANLIAAAMFMTGMAANPLVSKAAETVFGINFDWGTWLQGSIVPGLISLAILPPLIYVLERPQLSDAREAQQRAREQLKALGRWTYREIVLVSILSILIVLWATRKVEFPWFSFWHGEFIRVSHDYDSTAVAWIGVVALLLLRVMTWQSMAKNAAAWDTLIWLGGLIAMADVLKAKGFMDWFAKSMGDQVHSHAPVTAALILGAIYFYSMYGFSMMTGHVVALAVPFMEVAKALETPPLLIVPILAYFSCLCGVVTNYSTGPVIIYFGLQYVPAPRWFLVGFITSIVHMAVWYGVGLAWWKILGWW